jgi:predicted transcriptional regulator of viral defense system
MPVFDTLKPVRTAVVAPSELADWLMGRGRHYIQTVEVAELLGIEADVVSDSLQRAREAGKVISVTKGGWVPVPPEYRAAGAPPAIHFIDQMMRHLGHPYYVGFLSAAAIHGASHQATMVLQVVTPARLRDRQIGAGRIQFIQRSHTVEQPCELKNVPTGRVTVSTPAATVFDLVGFPRAGGGLSNVATVIGDLLVEGQLVPETLLNAARLHPVAVVQRAGYLIEYTAHETGTTIDLDGLAALVAHADFTPLAIGRPGSAGRDDRWRVEINARIEHDL